MQTEATVVSSPPSGSYPHLVLPSLPKWGHCLPKSDLPPQQQGSPTPPSRALSSLQTGCGHNQPSKSGAHRPCNTSLRLTRPPRLSPPPRSRLGGELPASAALSRNLAGAYLGPQAIASSNPPRGNFKRHKCLRTHLLLTKLLPLPSWQDPYFSLGIFRDILK